MLLAVYLLPKYIRNGYTTIPEFFENRFDRQTRLIMSGLLVFYLLLLFQQHFIPEPLHLIKYLI